MLRFLLKRLLLVIPVLFGLLVLSFVMIRLVPTDPAAALAGENSTVEQIEEIRREYGFDQPLTVQFWHYIKQVSQGDFGTSVYTNRAVVEDIKLRLPATIELTLVALVFASALGVLIGTLAAVWRNSAFDHIVRMVSVAGLAMASFWVAIMLQMLLSMELDLLPLHGRLSITGDLPPFITGFYLIDTLIIGDFETFADAFLHILLPAFTLSLGGLATIVRFTRSAMIETLHRDFIAYEEAVGYSKWRIIIPFALRNSLVTPLTQIGLLFGALISGAVVIEAIFDWPGLGSYLVEAIFASDYNAILAVTLLIGTIYAFVNIIVDIAQGLIDPRVADQM